MIESSPPPLGATLLHTRYGHWQHPKTGRFFIRPVADNFYGYPGIIEELAGIRDRALSGVQTPDDEHRIQWLAQAQMGALDIYQQNLSLYPVSREEILEDVAAWFSHWHRDVGETALLNGFFARLLD